MQIDLEDFEGTSIVVSEERYNWLLSQAEKVMELEKTINNMVPGMDSFEEKLKQGCTIRHHTGRWQLMDGDVEVASGETLRQLIVSVIFRGC